MEQISKKLMNWASILEPDTREQAERTSRLPFIFPHMALMPDAHLGKGATVGSVIPTEGAIIPAAVGVDIGCGMIAVRTQWYEDEFRERVDLAVLRESIEASVPLSAGKYNADLTYTAAKRVNTLGEDADRRGINLDRFAPNWHLHLSAFVMGLKLGGEW